MVSAKWTAPPTRREITLVLFALSVFIISYNLNSSLQVIGLKPTSSLQKFGLGSDPGFDPDGRRPQAYRDDLENLIFGEWKWDEGHVAGVDAKHSTPYKHLPGLPIHNELLQWGDDRPVTKLVKHVPGYTIIDSLVLCNDTFYIISDIPSLWPSLDMIGSSGADPATHQNWRIVSTEEAKKMLPAYAGSVHGVTLFSMEDSANQDSHTIPSLWRMYSSLDPEITPTGATILPPPSRIGYPRIATYNEPVKLNETIPRTRSFTGFHKNLVKTAFPSAEVMYASDWADLRDMNVPFVLERVVIADRTASTLGLSKEGKATSGWTAPFTEMSTSLNWWEPVRKTLARNLGVKDRAKEVVVTYIARQDEQWGPRLRDEDHNTLVSELQRLAKDTRCTVNIVSGTTTWDEKLRSILKSTVVLGVYGEELFDGIYMKPSTQSTLMEFWPAGTFTNDRELPVQSTGLKYTAWWADKSFSGDSLPPATPPANAKEFKQSVLIDSRAVVQAIRDLLH